jgi:hypothetical protein
LTRHLACEQEGCRILNHGESQKTGPPDLADNDRHDGVEVCVYTSAPASLGDVICKRYEHTIVCSAPEDKLYETGWQ